MLRPVELGHIGVGDGPTVVAVHGGLLGGRLTFGPVLPDWAERLRVLVPDRRGYEHSPGSPTTMAGQARDLLGFVGRHAGGHAHVLGFSYGGLVALTALQLERAHFASLTVVEAPAVTLCGRDPTALALRSWLVGLHAGARHGDARAAGREFLERMDPRSLGRVDALLSAGDPGVRAVADELAIWHTPLSPVGLAGVDVPALVVSGARSHPAMRTIGARVARVTGGAHRVLDGAGHAAHLVGRPFRDLLCAHVADAEARRSWDDPVVLAPWSPGWSQRFATERHAIVAALGDDAVEVAHIGSTAVAGLPAKPIVDVAVGVAGASRTGPVAERLRPLGYSWYDPPGADAGHRLLLRRADGVRLVHLHVVVHGSPWWRDRLAFRDALRADPATRDAYAARKRSLAHDLGHDREAYGAAKGAFVADVLRRRG